MGEFLEIYKKVLAEGNPGSMSGESSVEKSADANADIYQKSYDDPREKAIIDSRGKYREGSFADYYSLFLKQQEVEARRQQRAYAEQAPPEIVAPVKDLLSSSGDRAKVLEMVRKMTPEQKQETLRLAAGVSQQMGDDRGGAIGRTLGALSLGVSKGVSQPLMELFGMGGTAEEIEYIRKLDAIAAQEFAPARPGDPWYESAPLQATQMTPWMATVVGGNVAGTAAGKIGGQLLARGAAAGVPGAKTAFQTAGAVGRVPTAVGMQGATTRSVFEGAGGLAGVTAASFPGLYAQEVDSLKELGMQDDWKLRLLAGSTALIGGLVEGIIPNPFAGSMSIKNGAMNAARQYLWEALKRSPIELGEETLQGITSGLGEYVAQYIASEKELDFGDGETVRSNGVKKKTIADAFKKGWEQTKEAALPMAFLLGTPAVGGAGLSAIRARKYQLEQIKAKNFVSESDAQEAGIEGTSRRERMANVDAEIEQLTASESEAVAQSDREFISQQQGGQAPPMQGDVAPSTQQAGGVQIDENGRIVLSDEDAELDRQFFEKQERARTAAQGGNVATPVATGAETAPPVAPQPTVQPPQVPPAAPVVEPPQAPPVAQQPQPLYEVAGDENMVARVWPNPKGFLVNLTDMDSGEVDTRAMIFPTFEQAKQHADTVRLPSQQPQAQPVVTPEDPFAEQQQQVPQQTPALTREQQAESDRQYAQSQQMPSQGQIAPATVDPFSADENQQAGQVGRELWQKRLDEVEAERSSPNDDSPITKWESAVRQAIAEGKDVPSDVLNDFQEWDALLSDDPGSSSDARFDGQQQSPQQPAVVPPAAEQQKEPWQMSRAEAQDQGWGDNWSSVVRRGIDQGKDVPASVRDELFAYDKERESKLPKREEMPKAKIGDTVVRYTHKDGSGLLNNSELDLLRLTDEEQSELVELMDFGLQQPGSGTSGVFYFTKEGEQKHKRMIDLLSKASKKGVVRSETVLDQEPSWESEDGQIAVVQKQGRKKEVKPEQSESPASGSKPKETGIRLADGVYMIPMETASGIISPIQFSSEREMIFLRDDQGRGIWFYRSFMGTGGKTQGQWFPTGGVAALAKGGKWIVKGDTSDPGYGRPDLAAFAEKVNAVLPHSDKDMDEFIKTHLADYLKSTGGKSSLLDPALQAKEIDFGKYEQGNMEHYGEILNLWKNSYLNRVWGRRGESRNKPSEQPAEAEIAKKESPSAVESSTSDIDAMMEEEFKRQLAQKSNDQQPPPSEGKPPKKRSARKKKPPTEKPPQSSRSKEERKKEIGDLWNQLINESKNRLPSGLDPELLKIAAKLAIAVIEDGALTFAEFVKASVANIPGDMLDSLKPYIESAWRTAHRNKMTEDAGGKFDDYIKNPKAENERDIDKTPEKAEVVFGDINDGRTPDLQVAVVAANNQYGIWVKLRNRWKFIGNAGANREQAISRAKDRAESIARGETTGIAFSGKELVASQPRLIQVLENTLDPEILVSPDKLAVGDQFVGFGKYANVLVKDLIDKDPGYAEWLIGNSTTKRGKQVAEYLMERPEIAARIAQNNEDLSGLIDEKAVDLLEKFGLRASAGKGSIYLRGKTYDWKEQIRAGGGVWSQGEEAWRVTAEGFQKLQEELRGLSIPDGAVDGRLPAYIRDPELRKLREDVERRPDDRKSSGVVAGLVGEDTKNLISLGLKIGMPQQVVDEQIEDIGNIVDAYQSNKKLFILASEPGSGKTFVLGGAIRELRKSGAKKFVYVTLRTELINQIRSDLSSYGIDDVEFVTYPGMRDGSAKPSDVLIFDEAHSIKNVDSNDGSIQGEKAAKWIKQAGFTVFASATPMENPVQGKYFEPTGVFDDIGGFRQFALIFGANIKRVGDDEFIAWDRNALSETDARAAQEYFTKRGLLASRRIRLPESQVDSRFVKIKVSDFDADRYASLSKAAENNAQNLFGFGRPYIVNLQKRLLEASKVEQAISEAQSALDRGRFPIIFVETKAERKINIPVLIERLDKYNQAVAATKPGDKKPKRKDFGLPPAGVVETLAEYMQDTGESIIEIPPAIEKIQKHFGDSKVAVFTGPPVSPAKAAANLAAWRSGEKPVLVATMAKGGTGLSLHDKIGDHQTTQINLNLPWTATQVVQVTQRSARYGLKGKAEIIWLFADNIPFDQMLSARVGGRMADMGASVHGQEIKGASGLLDWDFEDKSFSGEYDALDESSVVEGNPPATPWADATVEDEGRWAGTSVNVSAKGKEEGYAGKVVRVLNKGETIEVQRDGFDAAIRVPAERVSVVDLVDNKFVSSAEQADKAAKILADMESNQEKMRQDKKQREGEKLANWVKAFEGSPREVTAAKDLFRKDFEKARENGVSDDRLMEIIDHGQANEMFTEKEAADLKGRIRNTGGGVFKEKHELLLDRAAKYREKGQSYKRDIADPAMRLQMAIANGNPIDGTLVRSLADELEIRLDYWEPILQKAEESEQDQQDNVNTNQEERLSDEEQAQVDSGSKEGDGRTPKDQAGKGRVVGSKTKVGKRAAHYEVVELSSLTGSHHPFGMGINEDFPAEWQQFQRSYHTYSEAQKQEVWMPKEGFDISQVIDATRFHDRGPTMAIERNGKLYVVGGTRRYMMLANLYRSFPDKALDYHNALVAEAEMFGLDASSVNGMDTPILIRVIDEPGENIAKLVDELNAEAQFEKDPAAEAASLGRSVGKNTIKVLRGINDEETLSKFLDRKGVDVVYAMINDNPELKTKTPGWVKDNSLTKDAKLAVQKAIMGAVISDATLIGQASPRLLQSVNGALAEILMLNQKGGEWGLSERIKEAITYDAEFRLTGRASSDRNIENWMNDPQQSFLEEFKKDPKSDGYRLWRYLLEYGGARKFRIALQNTMMKEARLDVGDGGLFADLEESMSGNEAFELLLGNRSPDVKPQGDAESQLTDNLKNPPNVLYQEEPNVYANLRSQALDLGISANRAGITQFEDFVVYSIDKVGEKQTRFMEALLKLSARMVGMEGIRDVDRILGGSNLTQEQYVQLAKETFASVPAEQVEAGIEAAMVTGLPQMAVGFSPAGSPVPRQGLMQDDFDQPASYKFKESDYRPAVVAYAKDKWGDAIAPNGKPTWQNFVRWFDDSAVVDWDGKPRVVYHGSKMQFDEFKPEFFERENNWSFSSDIDVARTYQPQDISAEKLYELYIGLSGYHKSRFKREIESFIDNENGDVDRNAIEAWVDEANYDNPQLWAGDLARAIGIRASSMYGASPEGQMVAAYLKLNNPIKIWMNDKYEEVKRVVPDGKHDGYIFYNVMDTNIPREARITSTVYKVLDSNQIKSATGNRGTFDPNNPGMLMQEEAVSRINMNYKDVTKRVTQLTEASQKLKDGEITKEEYADLVDRFKPVTPYENIPEPATVEDAERALPKFKFEKFGRSSEEIPAGYTVELRLDINAYKEHDVWINSIHRKVGAKEVTQYDSYAYVTNVNFVQTPGEQRQALDVARGARKKGPFARIEGKWKPTTKEKAVAMAEKALQSPGWTQVGYDPERHSYFYDRSDTRKVLSSADEVIQIGPLVLAKNPVYGSRSDVLFQGQNEAPRWYLKSRKLIQEKMGQKASSEQVLGMLRKNGVNDEELYWSGLEELLGNKQSVTKEEVLAAIDSGFQLLESQYPSEPRDVTEARKRLESQGITLEEGMDGEFAWQNEDGVLEDDDIESLPLAQQDDIGAVMYSGMDTVEAKYADYATTDNENYKELLIRLPLMKKLGYQGGAEYRIGKPSDGKFYVVRNGTWEDEAYNTEAEAQAAIDAIPKEKVVDTSAIYESSHWDEYNVLAHLRMTEMDDTNGKKVLLIEEIQSDWHQEGRLKGYAGKTFTPVNMKSRFPGPSFSTEKEARQWVSRLPVQMQKQMVIESKEKPGIPDAPFKKSWPMLAMKRAIQYAIEVGADKVAWVGGQQQADRYGLSATIEKIEYSGTDLTVHYKDDLGKVSHTLIAPDMLPTHIGQEATQRLMAKEPVDGVRSLEGLELKRGGEGLIAFYDQILPNETNKLIKKFGSRVVDSQLPSQVKTVKDNPAWVVEFNEDRRIHQFDITSAMRQSALQYGQPLFQQQVPSGNVKGWTKFISGTRALIGATNKADISTVIHEFAHPIRRFLLDRNIPQDQRVGITDEEIEMLEKKCGVKNGNWDVAAEEKLARMWEQYWFVGESPNKVLDSLFAKISRWMREVYNSITQITGSPLDPKVVELFDKLVQRGLTEEQRGDGRKSAGGGDSSTAKPSDTNEWSERVTSIKNQVAAMIRLRVGLPGFIEPSRETFQQWLDEASQLLKADPALGDRLIKELAQSNRTISHIEVAVLQMQFQHLNNQLDAASERLFAANEAKDSVAAAQARLDSDMLINQIEDFTDITKRAGTDAGRALVARRIALLSDFSLAALLRKARVANGGEKLNKEQQRQIEALSRKIEKLEGDLEKEIQKNNDLERQAAVKQGIEDDKKQAGKPVKNTARKRASDTVKEFAKKFSNIFGGAGGTETLQQTEDEKMVDEAVGVIKSYVASGVYSFGEFMAKVKQDLGAEVPVAAKVAFKTAWEDMKSQGDIPTPEVSEDQKAKEIGRLAKMIQYALVESGITEPEDVIDGVHESLQEVFEDITRRESMDAMSGYGQYSMPSQDPTDKIVRDLNAQYQQMAKKDDMQKGIAPKRSGRGRDEQTPELRKLIREVNEMKRSSKYFVTDPELQLKTIFQATRTALRNRIYDLSNAINVAEKPLLARTGVEFKGKEAEEIAAFRKLRDELLAEYKATFPKPGMTFEQRAAIVERALDRQIMEVEKQLSSGNVAPKPSAQPISTPSIDAKRARLDALRAQREAVREMQTTDEERDEKRNRQAEKAYIANLLNRIADYEDRRKQGYFGPKPKKEPRKLSPREIELSRQLENLKDEFFRYSAEYRLKNMTPAQRVWDYAKETMHLSRAIMTSFDLSAVFRQGGIASLAHPRLAASSSREMWNALRKEGAEFKTMSDIESDELYATAMRAGLSITTDSGKITKQEEAYMGRWAKWGIGKKGTKINTASQMALKPVTASARAYTTFLNSMRFRLFKYMVSNLGAGGEVTIDEAKIIASYVNAATGRADLGKFNQAMANLNMVFFAPRYVASRFQYLAMPFYLLPSSKVSGRVKKMIAMEYARHIMGLTAFLGLSVALGSLLTDDEEEKPTVEFDPRSSDWMKLKIGDTRIDPMAGLSQTVTLVGQWATGKKKGLKGDIQDLYGEKRKFGDPDLWDVTTGFLRKKLAPIPGAIVDLRVGENVIGEKVTVLSATTGLFVPLSFQEAGETFKARGIVGGAAVTALSLLGMGGGTYGPKTQYATADAAKREELLAKELDRMKWDSPDPAFKDFLTPSQLDQFTKKREQRKQALAYAASADPKRKTHSSDEAYKQSVAEQEEAMNSLIKSGMGFEEIRHLLVAYYKRNYGSAYETRNGTYQMKESLTNRLRVIRRKMAEKKS